MVDLFYPLFKKIMPLQTFRYAACGGFNTALDIVIFYASFHFLFNESVVHIAGVALKPDTASLVTAFLVTFPTGFYFSRYVVFTQSTVRGRVQLGRYLFIVLICIGLNYFFIRLFVDRFHVYPTVAKIFTTVIVVTFSYLSQKHFTFKTKAIRIHLTDQQH